MRLQDASVDDRPRHGRDVDDGALPARQHYPRLGLTGQEDAREIDVEHALPPIERHGLGRGGIGDPGTIDRDRQRPERVLGLRHSRAEVVGPRHVTAERDGAAAELRDSLDGAAEAGRVRQVEGCDIRPRFREPDRETLADAAAGARHQGDVAVQTEDIHGFLLRLFINGWPAP